MNEQANATTTWTPPDGTVGGSYGHGWETGKRYFLELFILVIISAAASIPAALAWGPDAPQTAGRAFLQIFAFMYWLFVFTPIDYGVLYGFVRGARGETPDVNDIFKIRENYINIVLAKLVTMVIIGIGFAALIVPGIYFACRLVFVPYLVVERNMAVTPALRESWELSRGRAGTVFLMGLTTIPIFLLGLLLCGVGVLFAMVWISATFASLYVHVTPGEGSGASTTEPDVPPAPAPVPKPETSTDEAAPEPEIRKPEEKPEQKPKTGTRKSKRKDAE